MGEALIVRRGGSLDGWEAYKGTLVAVGLPTGGGCTAVQLEKTGTFLVVHTFSFGKDDDTNELCEVTALVVNGKIVQASKNYHYVDGENTFTSAEGECDFAVLVDGDKLALIPENRIATGYFSVSNYTVWKKN